jgi:hypothetical protein
MMASKPRKRPGALNSGVPFTRLAEGIGFAEYVRPPEASRRPRASPRAWPPVHVVPQDRERYLDALEAANGGSLEELTEYLTVLAGRSLLDLLDQVGRQRDALRELRDLADEPWNPYGHRYLALRAKQEALLAVPSYSTSAPPSLHRKPGRPRWLTSERAMRAYLATRAQVKPHVRTRRLAGEASPARATPRTPTPPPRA